MKIRKITTALLALTMVAGMTACSKTSEEATTEITSGNVIEETSSQTEAAETTASDTTEKTETTEAATEAAPAEATDTETEIIGNYYASGEEIEFDLNSDGEKEKITYTLANDGEFDYAELYVNDSFHQMYFPVDSFLICDIDPTDNYFEIGVSSIGMSSDYSTDFLRYDNGGIYWIGNVEDTVDGASETEFNLVDSFGESLKINGDGTITAAKRLSLFQTWYAYSTYKVNNETNTLDEIQDMYYPYGEELMDDYNAVSSKIYNENFPASYTSQAVNLYSSPDTSSNTVAFDAQKFVATATDNMNWVYLVGENGTSGWLYYENNNVYDEFGGISEFGNNAFIDAVTGERFIDGFNEEGTYYASIFCDLLMYD